MSIVWIIVLVLLIYIVTVILISAIRALITKSKVKNIAKAAFKETFWDIFCEMLNPFNWI